MALDARATPPTIIFRGLEGIVSGLTKHKDLPSAPWVYEVSFQCPRGLSGAPLLREDTNRVAGCVIGNGQSFMEVSYTEEEIHSPDGAAVGMERERRVEGIYFGLAVCARLIMGLSLSPTLTVRQHIVRHGGAVIDEVEPQ